MNIQMVLDTLGEDLYTEELSRRELELDKDIIKLVQNACKTDCKPRVLELCRMLHHTSSFDMAIKVAAFYRHVDLQGKIQVLKEDREDGDRLVEMRDKRRRWTSDHDAVLPPRLPPADMNGSGSRRAFQDFAPPPVAARPGLAKATPIYLPEDEGNEDQTQFGRSKRKRMPEDDNSMAVDSESPNGSKRAAVEEELPAPTQDGTTLPVHKASEWAICVFIFSCGTSDFHPINYRI